MREIRVADDVKDIEPGTVLTFERGVEGQPGYEKFIRVYDLSGNPHAPRFAVYESAIKDNLRNRYTITADV